MNGVEIHDRKDGAPALDLIDLLTLCGLKAKESVWTCSDIECVGDAAERLTEASRSGIRMSGSELFGIAGELRQVVAGTFEARFRGAQQSWLRIVSVEGSCFRVFTDALGVHAAIDGRFQDVRPVEDSDLA